MSKRKKDVLQYAEKYLCRGWHVIPVPAGEKAPSLHGWQKLRLKQTELTDYFHEECNIGVLLGAPSKNLTDVDLDCDEAIYLAPSFLPPTDCVHGRKSKPDSHRYYRVAKSLEPVKFCDVDGKVLLELRSTGQQTIVPPSVHPSGERIHWSEKGKPSRVDGATLLCAVRRLGAATLIARHWPAEGSRDETTMALAGALLRAGLDDDDVRSIISVVGEAANDEEAEQRKEVVEGTRKRLDAGKEVTGLPRLAALLGEAVVEKLCDWLDIPSDETKKQTDGKSGRRTSQATELAALAANVRLFHTSEREAFAIIKTNHHRETWRIRDRSFRHWLAAHQYEESSSVPSSQALNDAIGALEGQALYGSPQREVFTRVARRHGSIWLDLADPKWRAVKISSNTWSLPTHPRVRFRRSRGMNALPVPQRGGSIDELRPFLNLASENDFVSLVSWLMAGLNPKGPYPVLVLQGEAGSAKSTTARVLRELLDPNMAPLRAQPRETRDLMIAATNSWCIAFDNVSYVPNWLSDALCRLSTGGGFSTRELYTDREEAIFDSTRPILINGIDGVISRGDLVDRSLVVYLPVIPSEKRQPEESFWRRFRKAQPRILGALLDAVSHALRHVHKVQLETHPRMADFCRWIAAAEPALGWKPGTFAKAYESNRSVTNSLALEASPIVPQLRRLCIDGEWSGTATDLLAAIGRHAHNQEKQRDWPKTAWALSGHLRRIAPNLREEGLDVILGRKTPGAGSKRIITITQRMPRIFEEVLVEFDRREESRRIQRYPRPCRFPR